MAGRLQTVEDKVGQWQAAFQAVVAEFDPQKQLSGAYDLLNTKVAGEGEGLPELDMQAYAARVNASMALARLQAANIRAAGTIAALLVQSGIKPAAIDYGDDA